MLGVFSVSFPLPVHAYIVLCIFDSHKLFERPLCEFWAFGLIGLTYSHHKT